MDIKAIVKDAAVIADSMTFEEALNALESNKTNTLLVTGDSGELVGEVTVADLLQAMIPDTLNGDEIMAQFSSDEGLRAGIKDALLKPVSEFMSQDFTAVTPDENMMSVFANALTHSRTRIPVVDHDNRPIGIISRTGLKHILKKFADS